MILPHKMIKNTFYLYIIMFAKIIFPMLTMPYLARILTINQYGAYVYIRACMVFINLGIDYGFIYSATKDIINFKDDKQKINIVISQVTGAKFILTLILLFFAAVILMTTDMIKEYKLFFWLHVLSSIIMGILPDYLFRGLENMQVLSKRFVITKGVSTILIFICVQSNMDFLNIAYLEFFSSIMALLITSIYVYLKGYRILVNSLFGGSVKKLVEGWNYFLSTVAPSIYGALNTIFIGNSLTSEETVFWGLAFNVISAVLNLYNPIINGIFPEMVRSKNLQLIKNVFWMFMPIISIGVLVLYILSDLIIVILGGVQYIKAANTLRLLLPVLLTAFPGLLFGFPMLGVIHKDKYITRAILYGACFHVLGIILLQYLDVFSLMTISVLRCMTEGICAGIKYFYIIKFKDSFINQKVSPL